MLTVTELTPPERPHGGMPNVLEIPLALSLGVQLPRPTKRLTVLVPLFKIKILEPGHGKTKLTLIITPRPVKGEAVTPPTKLKLEGEGSRLHIELETTPMPETPTERSSMVQVRKIVPLPPPVTGILRTSSSRRP